MTDVEATYDEFIASRRTGRRNAIHDIPGAPGGAQGPSDLSQDLAQLSINKSGEGEDVEKSQDTSDSSTKAEEGC